MDGWGLSEEKQICITTDNGSNLVRACHLLNWLHIPCFGHNLYLAITNAIKDDHRVARALGLIRKLITHFPIIGIKKRYLTKAQTDLGIPNHSLVIDCPKWWGSLQKMIARVLEQETALWQALSADRKAAHLVPT